MRSPKYLLDTHVFIWAAINDAKLSAAATRAISSAPHEKMAVSDITLQEIGLLLHMEKLNFSARIKADFESLLEHLTVLPITLEIAIKAPALKLPHGDQFDRIITATALTHRATLITKDGNITDSGIVPILW